MAKNSIRTCIACRVVRKKEDLIRLVVDRKGQVSLDQSGELPRRGAYVCDEKCLKRATEENLFSRAFRRKVKVSF